MLSPASQSTRIDPAAVRAYDIRGVAGVQVTEAGVAALGLGYAALARQRGLSRIGVGRDGRLSSPALERALVGGLVAGGMDVTRIGLGPTPKLAFAVRRHGLDGGIMVTASHNPAEENGLKVLLGPDRIHGAALEALVAMHGLPVAGGRIRTLRIDGRYVGELAAAAGQARPLRVVWDCGNGATGPAVEALTRQLPGRHLLLNTRIDGRFPSHHPDPAVAANLKELQAAVVRHGCEVGFAFDGDGDRIGVVDGAGSLVWADQLLLFLARDLLRRRPGATIVGDVKSSSLLFEGVAAAGGRALIAPSGYVLIREAMKREGALLAGELSGHIFFADEWDGSDDALYAAVRVLMALSRGEETLASFRAGLPRRFATPEFRIACPQAHEVVRQTARRLPPGSDAFDPAMGVRARTDDGWWLLRASGTEPKVTCRCEAYTEAGLDRLRGALAEQLGLCGIQTQSADLLAQSPAEMNRM